MKKENLIKGSSYTFFPEDPNALNITERKINSFRNLKKGWCHGDGVPFKFNILEKAIELNSYARSLGFLKTNAFPGADGEIMVTIYYLEHYLEFTIESNEEITFCRERNEEEVCYQEGLSFEETKEKIKIFGMEIWTQSEYYILSITTGNKEDLKASPSKTLEKGISGVYQSLVTNVSLYLETQSANILGDIIKKPGQRVNRRFIGNS